MLRIVYYCDAPYYGGAEYYLRLVACGLPRERFEVHMVMRPRAALDELRRPLVAAGVHIFEPREPAAPDPGHWVAVYKYLRRLRPHIFHVNLPGPYDGQEGSIAAIGRMAGIPVVTTEHLPMVSGSRRRRMLKKLSSRCVDLVITVSDANVTCLRTIHQMKKIAIHRIYNGVDISRYSVNGDRDAARDALELGKEHKAVGIIGRLDEQKGHDFFLEAARLVHREEPGARFFVVGDGVLRESLEAMSKDLGLNNVVRFTGYRRDIPMILSGLDVVVFASLHEGMPFALLEALAMAKPVVATDVYGLGEVVRDGETGRLVPARDSQAIAEATLDLLSSQEKAKILGANARELAATEFRLDRMLERTAEIYESLCAGVR